MSATALESFGLPGHNPDQSLQFLDQLSENSATSRCLPLHRASEVEFRMFVELTPATQVLYAYVDSTWQIPPQQGFAPK